MLSYWEKNSLFYYDYIIIGAGIVGLLTAIKLKEKYPLKTILIIERSVLPTGASTRNAGFACMGSVSELIDDLNNMSEDDVCQLFADRKRGLELLRNQLGDDKIEYRQKGSHELLKPEESYVLDKIDYLNYLLKPFAKQPVFREATNKIRQFGFSEIFFEHCIEATCEGELNTGKLMRCLMSLATEKGIEIRTGIDAISIEEDDREVIIRCRDNFRIDDIIFNASSICVCTNAFSNHFFPNEDVVPGRGQVLITKPIPNLKLRGIFHFDKGFYYYREIDGRILFGGGRNMDFKGEQTSVIELNPIIQKDLINKLQNWIIPDVDFEIDMCWSGIMAFGKTKQPIIKAYSQRIYGAFRMGGMGVALGALVAEKIVAKIQN